MRQVAIVDATLIAARTSIKNNEVKRDPYADALAQEGQSVVLRDESPCWGGSGPWPDPLGCHQFRQCTGPRAAAELLHGDEDDVYGDVGYQGIAKRTEMAANSAVFCVAMQPGP